MNLFLPENKSNQSSSFLMNGLSKIIAQTFIARAGLHRVHLLCGSWPLQASPPASSRWSHHPADLRYRRSSLMQASTVASSPVVPSSSRASSPGGPSSPWTFVAVLLTSAASPEGLGHRGPSSPRASPPTSSCRPHHPAGFRHGGPYRLPAHADLISWRTFATADLTAGLLAPATSSDGPLPPWA